MRTTFATPEDLGDLHLDYGTNHSMAVIALYHNDAFAFPLSREEQSIIWNQDLNFSLADSPVTLTNLEWLCLHFNDLDNGYTLIRSPKKPGVTLQRKSINIPASFAKLTKLENFMVYMNQLSGTIPAALKKHPNYSKWQINPQQDKVNLK